MDQLLHCEVCGHSGPAHTEAGCPECSCRYTLRTIVDSAVNAAKKKVEEIFSPGDERPDLKTGTRDA